MALTPAAPPAVKTLACPGCGASLTVRAPGHSLTVACSACGAILDARHPDFAIIEKHKRKVEVTPRIPLGSRGKLRGEMFEVVGFLIRQITVEGTPYSWREYLLFNPYLGFRWLTEYGGHWILAKAVSASPQKALHGQTAAYLGSTYRHFQTATAKVTYVVGEFPWRVRVGETAVVEDYIDPPRVLSCEKAEKETTWSIGDHIEGAYLWQAFGLTGAPPAREGVGVVQPSPFVPQARPMARMLGLFLAAAVGVQAFFMVFGQNRVVHEQAFFYERGKGSPAVVTGAFELTGRRSNVVIEITTDLSNNWSYFTLALINEETGTALDFGRELSRYSGYDSDGSWSEGSPLDTVYVPRVASGRYYLLIEPETSAPSVNYAVRVRRDVPRGSYLFFALAFLAVPPVIFWYRKWKFEQRRWAESDHPKWTSSAGDDDEDDD